MAITSIIVLWINRLFETKVLSPGKSILEFGPQDIETPKRMIDWIARARLGDTHDRVSDRMFDGETPREDAHKHFWTIFGFTAYESIDYYDARATYMFDLNHAVRPQRRYYAVSNFGTAEHCFNPAAVFQTAHHALDVGGIQLIILPAFGDINHGFYNIHPKLYFNLAKANYYRIADIQYIDNFYVRTQLLNEREDAEFDFSKLPIHLGNGDADDFTFRRAISDNFVSNYLKHETKTFGSKQASFVFDYCFVALRKLADTEFRMP